VGCEGRLAACTISLGTGGLGPSAPLASLCTRLVSLPRHKVRIQQQRVEAYTSQYQGWLDDDAGDKSWDEWVAEDEA
jgi:hypothetical protein